jgi:hypothetical protein
MPVIGLLSFSLFLVGAAWTSFSKQADQSHAIKGGIWIAFALMVTTLLTVF